MIQCLLIFQIQVLDLDEYQMAWVLNHLGHTLDVHKIHYRATSDIIERTEIAKILLMQDHGQLNRFVNKSLKEIQMEGSHSFVAYFCIYDSYAI